MNYCNKCGSQLRPDEIYCPVCGNRTVKASKTVYRTENRSKTVAGLLGIFLGGWGIHNFYLGRYKRGIWQIIVTIFTCGFGSVWGLIEGILILCDRIPVDADGTPLL